MIADLAHGRGDAAAIVEVEVLEVGPDQPLIGRGDPRQGPARLTEGDLSAASALVLSPAFEPLSACCQATRPSMVSVETERCEPEESNP